MRERTYPPCPICQGPVHPAMGRRYSGACGDDHGMIVDLQAEVREAQEITASWGRDTLRMVKAIQGVLRDPDLPPAARQQLTDAIDQAMRPPAFPMPSFPPAEAVGADRPAAYTVAGGWTPWSTSPRHRSELAERCPCAPCEVARQVTPSTPKEGPTT